MLDVESAATTPSPDVVEDAPRSADRPGWLRRTVVAWRPLLVALGVLAAVILVASAMPQKVNPLVPFFKFGLEVAVICGVAAGALVVWFARRKGQAWDADVVAAIIGGLAAFTVLGMLHGTPWGPNGLTGDPTYRTETVTRFADTWFGDFTYRGLPSWYAPAWFWVLGRAADLFGVEPWRMLKWGTVVSAMFVPVVAYVLWRRLVPNRVAVLIAAVPLIIQNFYEPYAWLVVVAIIPWWIEAVHAATRPDVRRRNVVVLGLLGSLMFMTYYYFFAIAAIALVIYLVWERSWAVVRRAALVLGIAALGATPYWLPLAASMLGGSEQVARWFFSGAEVSPVPFLDATWVGILCLTGLVYLVLTFRSDQISRALLILFAAEIVWYVIGFPAAVADRPLLTFRGTPLAGLLLCIAAVLAFVRLATLAVERFPSVDVPRLAGLGAILLTLFAGHSFVAEVWADPTMKIAHNHPLPNGQLPRNHGDSAQPVSPGAIELSRIIDDNYRGSGHPILLSDRVDVMALYPYYGFVQWNNHLSHPAARYKARIEFLKQTAALTSAQEFADRTADNPWDRIDVFLLRVEGEQLVFTYREDAFPMGIRIRAVKFPASLITADHFDIVRDGDYLVAFRK